MLKKLTFKTVEDSEGFMSCQVMPVKDSFVENSNIITNSPKL